MTSSTVVCVISLVVLSLVTSSFAFLPRRIKFARCESEVPMPRSVFMTCANKRGSACEVRIGSEHNIRAVFISEHNSTDVDSYVRWNSYLQLALPGQERDACKEGRLACPIVKGNVYRFTYTLAIQDFFPRSEYPVIWTLTDRDLDEDILCFKFKINIV